MTVARQVVPKRTYLISRRCTQRQFLLRPEPVVEQIYLYCLGEAAQRFDITLHGFIAMSNHQHLVVRDNRGNFPEFLAHLHKMIAKAMNRHRHRWENFWATEQPNAVYLVEAEDRFDKLVYLLANPVAAHLVDRVSDWPGASSFGMNLSGRTKTIPRPRGYFRAERGKLPAEVTLRIERPDGFETLTESEWVAKLESAIRNAEERAREERRVSGRPVLGRKAVLRANPTDRPETVESRGDLRPHVACKNKSRRIEVLKELVAFREQRAKARERLLQGELDVVFPYGTYLVRGIVLIEDPPRLSLSAA
jgi:putative transposase